MKLIPKFLSYSLVREYKNIARILEATLTMGAIIDADAKALPCRLSGELK